MFTNTIAQALGCINQIAFVDFNSSNCDREGQSFPVEYYLKLVEEFSEGINQARGNTRISCAEFNCDERARNCKCMLRSELLAQNNFGKKYTFTNQLLRLNITS